MQQHNTPAIRQRFVATFTPEELSPEELECHHRRTADQALDGHAFTLTLF